MMGSQKDTKNGFRLSKQETKREKDLNNRAITGDVSLGGERIEGLATGESAGDLIHGKDGPNNVRKRYRR